MHDWEYFLPYFRGYELITPQTVLSVLYDPKSDAMSVAPDEIIEVLAKFRSGREVETRIDAILAGRTLANAGSYGRYGYYIIKVGPSQYSVRDFFPERREIDHAETNVDTITQLVKDLQGLTKTVKILVDKRIIVEEKPDGTFLASGINVKASGATKDDAIRAAVRACDGETQD